MDHSPFEGLLKTLVPIIVFVMWAIVSGSGQKRKKAQEEALKRRRQEELERPRQRAAEPGEPSDEAIAKPGATKQEDWKRTIEDVLEEMGLPIERKPEPRPMSEPGPQKKAPPPGEPDEEEESLEDLEPEVATVPETVSKGKEIPKKQIQYESRDNAYKQAASPLDGTAAFAAPILAPLDEIGSPPASQHSMEDLQKFIVWSELLGKPVALREEEGR
jgi:hypothetical protein